MRVKAAINVEVGGRLVVDDLEIGDPGPTHVIVKQLATGVCHSQLHQIHNPALPRPLVLGHESTGVVLATGREVTHVGGRPGDAHLGAAPAPGEYPGPHALGGDL